MFRPLPFFQSWRPMSAIGTIDTRHFAKAARKIDTVSPEICEIVNGPVSADVVVNEYEPILSEGECDVRCHPKCEASSPGLGVAS